MIIGKCKTLLWRFLMVSSSLCWTIHLSMTWKLLATLFDCLNNFSERFYKIEASLDFLLFFHVWSQGRVQANVFSGTYAQMQQCGTLNRRRSISCMVHTPAFMLRNPTAIVAIAGV